MSQNLQFIKGLAVTRITELSKAASGLNEYNPWKEKLEQLFGAMEVKVNEFFKEPAHTKFKSDTTLSKSDRADDKKRIKCYIGTELRKILTERAYITPEEAVNSHKKVEARAKAIAAVKIKIRELQNTLVGILENDGGMANKFPLKYVQRDDDRGLPRTAEECEQVISKIDWSLQPLGNICDAGQITEHFYDKYKEQLLLLRRKVNAHLNDLGGLVTEPFPQTVRVLILRTLEELDRGNPGKGQGKK